MATPTGVVLGRLASGVTAAQASDAVTRIVTAFYDRSAAGKNGGAAAKTRRPRVLSLVSVRDELVGPVRPMVIVTAVSASLVLLVACLNAAQLLLTRVASRQGEFAVRRALGATRGQLARQVLVESLLLSLSAGLVAIPAAVWTAGHLDTLVPPALRGAFDIAINVRVVAATAAVSVCTALMFGVLPALSLTGRRDGDMLRATPGSSGDRFSRLSRRVLVVTQIAAALTLLAGAATVMRTVSNLMQLDIGVRPEHTLTFDLMLPKATFPSNAVNKTFAGLEERLRAIPGVEAVGSTTELPGDPGPAISWGQVVMDGRFVGSESSMRFAVRLAASPGYLAAAGIDRVAGRDFDAGDRADSACVVIVSEGLAKVAGRPPAGMVGRRLDHGDTSYQKGCAIVGVVRDVLLDGPERQLLGRQYTTEATLRSAIYVPYEQYGYRQRDRHFVVRAQVDPTSLLPAIRAGVAEIDRSLPVYNVRTFEDIRSASLADRRFAMTALLIVWPSGDGSLGARSLQRPGPSGSAAYAGDWHSPDARRVATARASVDSRQWDRPCLGRPRPRRGFHVRVVAGRRHEGPQGRPDGRRHDRGSGGGHSRHRHRGHVDPRAARHARGSRADASVGVTRTPSEVAARRRRLAAACKFTTKW